MCYCVYKTSLWYDTYRVSQKKGHTILLSISLLNIDLVKCSNKTVHRHTGHVRQSSCCNGRRLHSSHLICGLRIAQISTLSSKITRFGEWCKIVSTRKKWRTWTSWESNWLRSGLDCNRTWLMMPSTSGADACVRACVRARGGHFEYLLWLTALATYRIWFLKFIENVLIYR